MALVDFCCCLSEFAQLKLSSVSEVYGPAMFEQVVDLDVDHINGIVNFVQLV